MSPENPFADLDALRVNVAKIASKPQAKTIRPRRPGRKKGYVVISADWLDVIDAARPPLSGAAWAVVRTLMEEFSYSRGAPVKLGNGNLERRGVGRQGKTQALDRLVGLGLIKTEGNPGQCPRVTALVDPFGWEQPVHFEPKPVCTETALLD
jgi:hypothetical protein